MKFSVFFSAAAAVFLLAACGYKGDLYLPKENDKARFGVIQTGLQFSAPAEPTAPQTTE